MTAPVVFADYGSQWRGGPTRNNSYPNEVDIDGDGHGVLSYLGRMSDTTVGANDGLLVMDEHVVHASVDYDSPTWIWSLADFEAASEYTRSLGVPPQPPLSFAPPGPGLRWLLAGQPDIEDAASNTFVIAQNQVADGSVSGVTPGAPEFKLIDADTGLQVGAISVTAPTLPAAGDHKIIDSIHLQGVARVALVSSEEPPAAPRYFLWVLRSGEVTADTVEITGLAAGTSPGSLVHIQDGEPTTVDVAFATRDELFFYSIHPAVVAGARLALPAGPGGWSSSSEVPRLALAFCCTSAAPPAYLVVLRAGSTGAVVSTYDTTTTALAWSRLIGGSSGNLEDYDLAATGLGGGHVYVMAFNAASASAILYSVATVTGDLEWQTDATEFAGVDVVPRVIIEGFNSLNVNVLSSELVSYESGQILRWNWLREYDAFGQSCTSLVLSVMEGSAPSPAVEMLALAFRSGQTFASIFYDDASLEIEVAEKRGVDVVADPTEVTQGIQSGTAVDLVAGREALLRVSYSDANRGPLEIRLGAHLCDSLSAHVRVITRDIFTPGSDTEILDSVFPAPSDELDTNREDGSTTINAVLMGADIAQNEIRADVGIDTMGLEATIDRANNTNIRFGVIDAGVPDPCFSAVVVEAYDSTVTLPAFTAARDLPGAAESRAALLSLPFVAPPLDYFSSSPIGQQQLAHAIEQMPVVSLEAPDPRRTMQRNGRPFFLSTEEDVVHRRLSRRRLLGSGRRFCTTTPPIHLAIVGANTRWIDPEPDGRRIGGSAGHGIGGAIVGESSSGDGLVHELGHLVASRDHVDCGLPASGRGSSFDPDYPYPPDQISDTTEEFGFWGTVWSGASDLHVYRSGTPSDEAESAGIATGPTADVMSYCRPRWTSDYTWDGLRDSLADLLGPAPAAATSDLEPSAWVLVEGKAQLFPDGSAIVPGSLEVHRVIATDAPLIDPIEAAQHVQSQQGNPPGGGEPMLLVRATTMADPVGVTQTVPVGTVLDGNSQVFPISVVVPVASADAVVQVDVTELLSFESLILVRSANLPMVSIVSPTQTAFSQSDWVELRWSASDADGDPLAYLVQFSDDGGATWEVVEEETNERRLLIPAGVLSSVGTNAGLFRVTALDGFGVSWAMSPTISITGAPTSPQPPLVRILEPLDGGQFGTELEIPLYGSVFDYQDGSLPPASVEWLHDGNLVAVGRAAVLPAGSLGLGEVTLTMRATDSDANQDTDTVTFYVPEPSASSAFVIGSMLLAWLQRRRSRARASQLHEC